MSKIFCSSIYYSYLIDADGYVRICCEDWCNSYSLGNILEDDFETILNSEKTKSFLNQFKNQKFTYCNLQKCPVAREVSDEEYDLLTEKSSKGTMRSIRLIYDITCNCQCIFCRPTINPYRPKNISDTLRMNSEIRKILPVINSRKWTLSINGAGEFLASPSYRSLVKDVVSNYPDIKFDLISNGTLLSERVITGIGLTDRINLIEISVHAYHKETYNKLVKGSNFDNVVKNLEYISYLHKQGKIKGFFMNFVVTSLNYTEMVDFIEWALTLGAKPMFLNLIHIRGVSKECYDQLNISNPNHPEYNRFVQYLKKVYPYKDKINIPLHYLELEETNEDT